MPRPRKPTVLKIAEGNPGKRPLNKREPVAPPGVPHCPTHLNREAKAEWKRICKELAALKLLSIVDRAALSSYCQSWARYVDAEKKRDVEGDYIDGAHGGTVIAPWVKVSKDERATMLAYLREFGLSPGSRSKLTVPDEGGGKSEIESFLSAKRG